MAWAWSDAGRRRPSAPGEHPLVDRRATSSIRSPPGVALPRARARATRRGPRPDARGVVVERGQEALDVLDRAQVGGAGHLLVEGGGHPLRSSAPNTPCHRPSAHGLSRMKR